MDLDERRLPLCREGLPLALGVSAGRCLRNVPTPWRLAPASRGVLRQERHRRALILSKFQL
jgi:hypothetical protein